MPQKLGRIFFLPFMSFLLFASFANEGGHLRFTPKTPEAASFEKMAEIPVGNYTGTPNITIPLYTIEFGDLKIPISLDYLGTAIRVDQEASWVGLNWILNAGGAITTQLSPVYDISGVYPNEERRIWNYLLQTAPMTKMFCTGDYGQNIYYKIDGVHPDWSGGFGRNYFSYPVTIEDTLTYQGDLPKQIYNTVLSRGDGESPTYHACFLGNSISFIWDRLKKEFFIIGENQGFSVTGSYTAGLDIIDGNGVKYEFHAIEWGQPEGVSVDPSVARVDYTFYLSRIISPTGRTITFQYSQNGQTHPVYKVNEQLFDGNYPAQTLSGSYGQQGVLDLTGVGMNGANRVRTLSQFYTFHPIRLLSITTDDQIVKFVQSTQARRDIHGNDYSLQRIEIYRKLQGCALSTTTAWHSPSAKPPTMRRSCVSRLKSAVSADCLRSPACCARLRRSVSASTRTRSARSSARSTPGSRCSPARRSTRKSASPVASPTSSSVAISCAITR